MDTITETSSLKQTWAAYRADHPDVRIRDAAAALDVSEAELLATGCGENATRLEGDWAELLKQFPTLGRVMVLTRNESAVHERKGTFGKIEMFGRIGQVLGADIDLRLFLAHWHFGFAVRDEKKTGAHHSLQFFDRDGTAVHKVYLQPEGNQSAFDGLVSLYASPNQSPDQVVLPREEPEAFNANIPREELLSGWSALQDTHDFFILLKKFRAQRREAIRIASGRFTQPVVRDSVRIMLEQAATDALPIMVFVGSEGAVQIHTGPVKNIKILGPWLNVLDPDFNLHLREDHIHEAWIVTKPTRDGDVTSLEVYDAAGELIVQFFGKRKPGEPELEAWRSLLSGLPRLTEVSA